MLFGSFNSLQHLRKVNIALVLNALPPCLLIFPSILLLFLISGENFSPWRTGLLQFPPAASGPAYAPDAKFPLVLAAKRTNRPDVLTRFRHYRGGWDITNRHYWAVSLF